ncbi:MAG: ABC transporter ATP-binding protein [Hyphomicrobiaceae bacterium]
MVANGKAGMGATVRYEAVAKTYGEVHALRPTTFEIGSGELVSIIGPSGSGKTTLLGVTAGYITPTAGAILVDGRDIIGVAPFRRNIGMVFQNYSLFPHMTVAENIAFPLKMRGVQNPERRERVERMLGTVRLSGFGDRKPSQLSGGQQQRVALARAAVYGPLLLLMDEPLSALDKNLREEMQYEIKQFQRTLGATVLYVTHDQNEAAAMSDRIGIMSEGRLVQVGTARDLYEHPANRFVAAFLGEANLFTITARRETASGIELETAEAGVLKAAGGKGGAACVRPESISIDRSGDGAENRIRGRVADGVYTAGSLRYRVDLPSGMPVTVRMPSERSAALHPPGTEVELSWRASDTILVEER